MNIIEFLKKLPPVTLIAVMGDCGKSTVAHLIDEIFSKSKDKKIEGNYLHIDLEDESSFEEYLKSIKRDQIILVKVSADILKTINQLGIIPTVSVFTMFQNSCDAYVPLVRKFTYTNYIIGSDDVIDQFKNRLSTPIHGKMLRTGVSILPRGARMVDMPYFARENASLAVRVAELFEISNDVVVGVLNAFKGLKGRLEVVRKVGDIVYINDAFSEQLASLRLALTSIAKYKNGILIFGGNEHDIVSDPQLDTIAQYCHTFIFIPGTGSQKLYKHALKRDDVVNIHADSIEDAVKKAGDRAGKGDVILFSPGFHVTKLCGSREERSVKFTNSVKLLTSQK